MSYDINDIETLEFPECVQARPGMYLGECGLQKNVCIREITDNSVTEIIKGYGDIVVIDFFEDGTVRVRDNGRGVPCNVDRETGQTGIEKCLASLHSGGNFSNDPGKVGPGTHGVGGACCNAMAEMFEVDVYRNGHHYRETFSNGLVKDKLKREKIKDEEIFGVQSKEYSGTTITFKFNNDFFSEDDLIDVDDIINRLRYTVYTVPGVTIKINDFTRSPEDGGGEYEFKNDGGIEGMLDYTTKSDAIVTGSNGDYEKKGIFHISTNAKMKEKVAVLKDGKSSVREQTINIPIEVAFKFSENDGSSLQSFANTIHTTDGGVHQDALKRALVDTFGKLAKK